MSDHSSSTGSSGSSTNSWTLLTPEEAAAENVGQLDDGTESLGDAPSLSDELVTAAVAEIKPSDVPAQCILSEEGHQVCQETAPESGDGPALCCPLQPDEPEAADSESRAPVIVDIVTSSPGDDEPPDAAFVSSALFAGPGEVAESDEVDREAAADQPEPAVAADEPEDAAEKPKDPILVDLGVPEVIGPVEKEMSTVGEEQEEEEEEKEEEPSVLETQDEQGEESPASCHDDGLRHRRSAPPGSKTSDKEDEEEDEEEEEELEMEMEFKLPEKKQGKMAWSAKKCMVGVAVLLFLGALFLSGDLDPVDPVEVAVEESQPTDDPAENSEPSLGGRMSSEFQAVLDLFDSNGSGDLSQRELDAVVRMLGKNPLGDVLESIVKEMKADDGRNLPLKEAHQRRFWEHLEKIRRETTAGADGPKSRQGRGDQRKEDRNRRAEWESRKPERLRDRQERRRSEPWKSHHQKQRAKDMADFWRAQEQKLRRPARPRRHCSTVEECAAREGLFPVELSEFQELLEGYLGKLEASPGESKDFLRWLVADSFGGKVFPHERRAFVDFARDVADVLEDMADAAEGADRGLEDAMEEFEREALWKFAATEEH